MRSIPFPLGSQFGSWTTISDQYTKGIGKESKTVYLCRCVCSTEREIRHLYLANGKSAGCGCIRLTCRKPFVVGTQFGRLIVIGEAIYRKSLVFYMCRCDCGTEKEFRHGDLQQGGSQSCGCLKIELTKNRLTVHGQALVGNGTRLYHMWQGVKARCTYSNRKDWMHYGGRGITMCNEWMDSSSAFFKWALANGYQDDLQIDRIDNDGNYCPENCRFVTASENCKNRRNSLKNR